MMEDTKRPEDHFSRELSRWLDFPQATHVKPTTVQTVTFLGNAESWIVQTIRGADGVGESVFLQRISADGSMQLVIPPRVADTIAGQRERITAMNRRKGARRAVETKRLAGLPVGNPEALRKARRKRARKS